MKHDDQKQAVAKILRDYLPFGQTPSMKSVKRSWLRSRSGLFSRLRRNSASSCLRLG
jgi:hypothetical protein